MLSVSPTQNNDVKQQKMDIMKRFSSYLTLLIMAALSFTFVSCDDDWVYTDDWYNNPYYDATDYTLELARTMNGSWRGAIINEYTNDKGQREQTQCDADFTFVQYNYNTVNGTGYETDYDGVGNTQTLRFKWYVDYRTSNIYVEYESGYRFVLDSRGNSKYSGFSLDDYSFDGVMEGVNNDEYIFFQLDRQNSYNAPKKTKSADNKPKAAFGKGGGLQFEHTNAPMMLHKR